MCRKEEKKMNGIFFMFFFCRVNSDEAYVGKFLENKFALGNGKFSQMSQCVRKGRKNFFGKSTVKSASGYFSERAIFLCTFLQERSFNV